MNAKFIINTFKEIERAANDNMNNLFYEVDEIFVDVYPDESGKAALSLYLSMSQTTKKGIKSFASQLIKSYNLPKGSSYQFDGIVDDIFTASIQYTFSDIAIDDIKNYLKGKQVDDALLTTNDYQLNPSSLSRNDKKFVFVKPSPVKRPSIKRPSIKESSAKRLSIKQSSIKTPPVKAPKQNRTIVLPKVKNSNIIDIRTASSNLIPSITNAMNGASSNSSYTSSKSLIVHSEQMVANEEACLYAAKSKDKKLTIKTKGKVSRKPSVKKKSTSKKTQVSAFDIVCSFLEKSAKHISNEDAKCFCNQSFTKEHAGITYPLLLEVDASKDYQTQTWLNGKNRYAKHIVTISGKQYYVTNHIFYRNVERIIGMIMNPTPKGGGLREV